MLGRVTLFAGLFCALSGAALAAGVDELPPDIQKSLYARRPSIRSSRSVPAPTATGRRRRVRPGRSATPVPMPATRGVRWQWTGCRTRSSRSGRSSGLVKDVIITQSNLKDSVQIQQMRQLVDQGVDAIIVCCSNPTALNQTIKYAYDKGVPVFSFTGYLTSPYAVNSSNNYQLGGFQVGEWMGEEIGKKGNVLVVEGIPGNFRLGLAGPWHEGGPSGQSGRQDRRRRRRHVDRPGRSGRSPEVAFHPPGPSRWHRRAICS